jgi:tetratricopeptide (TPR) repeat protein
MSADPAKDRDEARALADRAMHLAPHDPMVLGYCGGAFIWTGQTAQAIDCLERSLELNPNNGLIRLFYGSALWADGRPEAGIQQLDLFLRLSPKDPYAGRAYWFYAWCYLTMNDFVKAEEAARRAVKLLPDFGGGYISLASSLTALGRAAESQEAIDKLHRLAPRVTPEAYEDFMSHVIRQPVQAEIIITRFNKAWKDAVTSQPR